MPGVIDELYIEIRYRDDRRGLRRLRRRGIRAAQQIDRAFDRAARGIDDGFSRAARDANRNIRRIERQADNSSGRVELRFEEMADRARQSQQQVASDARVQSGRFERAWSGAAEGVGQSLAAAGAAVGAVFAGAGALGAQLEQAQAGRALLTADRRAQAEQLDRAVGEQIRIAPEDIARAVTRLSIGLGQQDFAPRDVEQAAQLSSLLTAQEQELDQRTIGQAAVLADRLGIGLAQTLQTILDIGQQTGIDPNFIQEQAFEGAQTAGVQTRQQFEQFLRAAVAEVNRTGDVARLVTVGDELAESGLDALPQLAQQANVDIRIRGQSELDDLIASMARAQEEIGPISAAAADARVAFEPLVRVVELGARAFSAMPGPMQSVVAITGTLGAATLAMNFLLGAQGGLIGTRVVPAIGTWIAANGGLIASLRALSIAMLTNPLFLIGTVIAGAVVGLIFLERRFQILSRTFNAFRRAFSFIPGISAPEEQAETPTDASVRAVQPQNASISTTTPLVPSATPTITPAIPRVPPGPGQRIVFNFPNLQVFNEIAIEGAGDPAEVAVALEGVTGERIRAVIADIADERIGVDNARVLSLTPRNRTV